MGTKNNPGKYDCYANAHPDEPMFILLGRDPFAPMLVEKWAELRELARGPSAKVDEARACAEAMRKWLANSTSTTRWHIVDQRADDGDPVIVNTFDVEADAREWAQVNNAEIDDERYLVQPEAVLLPSTPKEDT